MDLFVLLIAWTVTTLLSTVIAMAIGHAADRFVREPRRHPRRGFDVLPLSTRKP